MGAIVVREISPHSCLIDGVIHNSASWRSGSLESLPVQAVSHTVDSFSPTMGLVERHRKPRSAAAWVVETPLCSNVGKANTIDRHLDGRLLFGVPRYEPLQSPITALNVVCPSIVGNSTFIIRPVS